MSEIVNDLKLSNLEISEESGIRLTSQNPTIKHTRDNNTSSTFSISSDGILSLTGTSVSLTGATTLTNRLTLSNVLIGSVQAGLTGATTAADAPVSLITSVTTLNLNAVGKLVLLAAGTAGQVKIITATELSNSGTTILSFNTSLPANKTITFDALGDSATVLYTGAAWVILSVNGAAISS